MRRGIATSYNMLGDALRAQGRLEEAERSYRDAHALLTAIGSPECQVALLNLALVLLARGRYREAAEPLGVVLDYTRRTGRRGLEGVARVFLLPVAAAVEDW